MRSKGRLLWPAWIPGVFVMLCGAVFLFLDVRVDQLTERAVRMFSAANPFVTRSIVEYPEAIIFLGFVLALWGVWYRKGWERTELITGEEAHVTKCPRS